MFRTGAQAPSLAIGMADDACEHAADRVAQAVTASVPPPAAAAPHAAAAPAAEPTPLGASLRARPARGPHAARVAAAIRAELGRGAPLLPALRARIESHAGADLSAVRLHDDPTAATLSRALHAAAFAVGDDIFLSRGAPRPGSATGDHLLAHEATHAVQQRLGGGSASAPLVQRSPLPGAGDQPLDEPHAAPIWVIAASKAGATVCRDPDRGFAAMREGRRLLAIPAGTPVDRFGLDREEAGVTYTMVEWLDGARARVDWVPAAELAEYDDTYATPLGEQPPQKRLKKEKLPFRTDAGASFISGKEAAALKSPEAADYRLRAEALLASKTRTPAQEQLLERARHFVDDGSIPTPERMDEIGLDAELLARIKTYYRFLVKEGLVTGNVVGKGEGTYGARTPGTAHELSTKWMLYTGNTGKQNVLALPENRLEFARQIVAIDGNDGETEWATTAEVAQLAASVQGIHFAVIEREVTARGLVIANIDGLSSVEQLWSDPKVAASLAFLDDPAAFKAAFAARWEKWRGWDTPEDLPRFLRARRELAGGEFQQHQRAIDAVVGTLRTRFSAEGIAQTAPALEGYEKGSPERYPNLLDVAKTEHLTGSAADIHFDYKFNYYDPIVDQLALVFGLRRAAIDAGEYWHYQAIGEPYAPRREQPVRRVMADD